MHRKIIKTVLILCFYYVMLLIYKLIILFTTITNNSFFMKFLLFFKVLLKQVKCNEFINNARIYIYICIEEKNRKKQFLLELTFIYIYFTIKIEPVFIFISIYNQ